MSHRSARSSHTSTRARAPKRTHIWSNGSQTTTRIRRRGQALQMVAHHPSRDRYPLSSSCVQRLLGAVDSLVAHFTLLRRSSSHLVSLYSYWVSHSALLSGLPSPRSSVDECSTLAPMPSSPCGKPFPSPRPTLHRSSSSASSPVSSAQAPSSTPRYTRRHVQRKATRSRYGHLC